MYNECHRVKYIHTIICYDFEFLFRLDAQLQKVETDEGFSRWLPSCDIYCDIKRLLTEKEKESKKAEISKCARERWFLLSLKAKFAGL